MCDIQFCIAPSNGTALGALDSHCAMHIPLLQINCPVHVNCFASTHHRELMFDLTSGLQQTDFFSMKPISFRGKSFHAIPIGSFLLSLSSEYAFRVFLNPNGT